MLGSGLMWLVRTAALSAPPLALAILVRRGLTSERVTHVIEVRELRTR